MTTQKTDEALELQDNTMAIVLTVRRFGTRGRVKKESVKQMLDAIAVDPSRDGGDDDVIQVSKTLLEHELVSRISGELAQTRAGVRDRALPIKFLKRGIYLYPIVRMEAVESFLRQQEATIGALLDELEEEYPAIIEADRERLEPRGLFDPGDYPSIAALRAKVRVEHRWARFSAPTDIEGVPPEIIAAEREKARALWSETFESIRAMQCQVMSDFVDGLLATLRPGEDGKKKVLKQARVEKMQDFLRNFPLDNVTGYKQLEKLVGKARDVLEGVDAEVIRTEAGYRARLDKALGEVQGELKPLVVKATRRVRLKD